MKTKGNQAMLAGAMVFSIRPPNSYETPKILSPYLCVPHSKLFHVESFPFLFAFFFAFFIFFPEIPFPSFLHFYFLLKSHFSSLRLHVYCIKNDKFFLILTYMATAAKKETKKESLFLLHLTRVVGF